MTSVCAEHWYSSAFCNPPTDPHIVIAMSGGVDSSVAAIAAKNAGFKCSALFMKNWNEPSDSPHCHWEDDVGDALDVCERLGIEINTIDLSQDYWDKVFQSFLDEYQRGRTPNPDILCNREIKFRAFLDAASDIGGDLIATGHYVQNVYADGHQSLCRGADANKDQSYFLYTLNQAALGKAVFPVGHLDKTAVRQIARDAGLSVHEKKDSTGICFIGERHFREFLSQYVAGQPGPIVSESGHTIGQHHGAVFYTLGQRQGLGIGGVSGAGEAPWFVSAKDLDSNTITAVQGHDHPALLSTTLVASEVHWIAGDAPDAQFRCTAKTRYRQKDQACVVELSEGSQMTVTFDQPQRAVTPGQSVVLYRGDACLGGGFIDRTC